MAVITRPLTVDDLLRLGSDARVEVVRGEVVEMTPAGGLHNWVAKRIAWALDAYVEEHKSGLVLTDSLLYVLSERMTASGSPACPTLPISARPTFPLAGISSALPRRANLAVEVMSR